MGLVHIYCGDGKGKTTAAIGLSIRAAGSGKNVIFCHFKNFMSAAKQIRNKNFKRNKEYICFKT